MQASMDRHLSASGSRQLRQVLDAHCRDAGALSASLLDECGAQIACGGPVEVRDNGEIAALAAGAFASTRALANQIGENHFDGLMHHGRNRHFYLSPVNEDALLLTIFSETTVAGIVRLTATRSIPPLRAILQTQLTAEPMVAEPEPGGSSSLIGSVPPDPVLPSWDEQQGQRLAARLAPPSRPPAADHRG